MCSWPRLQAQLSQALRALARTASSAQQQTRGVGWQRSPRVQAQLGQVLRALVTRPHGHIGLALPLGTRGQVLRWWL